MTERPSFRSRSDGKHLWIALSGPWICCGLMFLLGLGARELYRAGMWSELLDTPTILLFYGIGMSGGWWIIGSFLFGVWRLIRRKEYRQSSFGRWWPFLMWLNLCAVMPFYKWVTDL